MYLDFGCRQGTERCQRSMLLPHEERIKIQASIPQTLRAVAADIFEQTVYCLSGPPLVLGRSTGS